MKKGIVVLFAVLLVPVSAHAGKYGMAGRGLGSMLITGQGFVQVFAATTNETLGTQTFGISSGTSNCTAGGTVKEDREREAFVEAALPNVLDDASRGDGEYLNALGTLYGCDASALPDFGKAAQDNYETICQAEGCSNAAQFLTSLEASLSTNPSLATACPKLKS